MENEIVASNVSISVKLPKILEFRNEDEKCLTNNKTEFHKEIGNATNETELYVEYTAKSSDELAKMKVDIDNLKEVVFQSKITYVNMEGNKCMRVITKTQNVSDNKEEVRKQAKYDILSVNAIQQCGKLAKKGEYRAAQSNAMAFKQMMKKEINNNNCEAQTNYIAWNKNMNVMNNVLQEEQYNEALNDLEEVENCDGIFGSSEVNDKSKKREVNRKDVLSQNIYSNANINTKKMMNKKK